MLLRKALVADVPALIAMQEPAAVAGLGHIFPPSRYPFPRTEIAARWIDEIGQPDVDVFVSPRDDRIVGFAAVRGDELLHFGTALDTWGTGLAALIHDELAFSSGRLRVFEQNLRARRFYEKMGWRPTEVTSRSAFPPCPLLMHYVIGRPPSVRPRPSGSRSPGP